MANKMTADAIIKLLEQRIAEAKALATSGAKLGERQHARTKAGVLEDLLDDILGL